MGRWERGGGGFEGIRKGCALREVWASESSYATNNTPATHEPLSTFIKGPCVANETAKVQYPSRQPHASAFLQIPFFHLEICICAMQIPTSLLHLRSRYSLQRGSCRLVRSNSNKAQQHKYVSVHQRLRWPAVGRAIRADQRHRWADELDSEETLIAKKYLSNWAVLFLTSTKQQKLSVYSQSSRFRSCHG
jgi:hypothetical protein